MDSGSAPILERWGLQRQWHSYGGHECPVSALAEYVMNTINPGLDPGSKITWDDVVIRTPWMTKRLHGMTVAQEMMVRCQALPVPGESSELEVVLERMYSEQLLRSRGRGKLTVENPAVPGHKPVTASGLTKAGARGYPQAGLKEDCPGWRLEYWDEGFGPECRTPIPSWSRNRQTAGRWTDGPAWSFPLTSELLALDEEMTEVLDYDDVEENIAVMPDPEIAQAVAPHSSGWRFRWCRNAGVTSTPGFEPEVSRSGYDVNLVRTNPTELGSISPVMARENEMLDRVTSRTPGAGRPGTNMDPGHTENK